MQWCSREGGGLSHLLPGHRVIANEQHRKEIAAIWNVPPDAIKPEPGKHTMAMFEAVAKGEIKVFTLCVQTQHSHFQILINI